VRAQVESSATPVSTKVPAWLAGDALADQAAPIWPGQTWSIPSRRSGHGWS